MHEKCRQMGLGLLQCLLPKTISDQMKWKVNFSFVGREGSFCCYHDVSTSIARTMKVTSKIREMSTKKPWEILWEPGTFQESRVVWYDVLWYFVLILVGKNGLSSVVLLVAKTGFLTGSFTPPVSGPVTEPRTVVLRWKNQKKEISSRFFRGFQF